MLARSHVFLALARRLCIELTRAAQERWIELLAILSVGVPRASESLNLSRSERKVRMAIGISLY